MKKLTESKRDKVSRIANSIDWNCKTTDDINFLCLDLNFVIQQLKELSRGSR